MNLTRKGSKTVDNGGGTYEFSELFNFKLRISKALPVNVRQLLHSLARSSPQ